MFPHMYKVRPPRPGRRGEGPPSAECEWQGDTTRRRNSNNRWNPNNLEGTSTPTPSTSTPASPLPATPFAPPFATPPPIPAPPPEAQETLHKMTSPAARLDGVEATNQANFNASPVPWRRERSRTSSPAAAKQTPVRRRERPVSAHSQETDPARVMPSPIPASVSEPAPGKENSSRDSSPAVRRLRQENRSRTNSPRPTTPKELPSSRDSSPAVRRLKQENRSRTNSPRPTTPKELPSSRPESASPIPTMEAPAYAKTYTPPVPLEAVVVDATSPQPQTFTTTVPIVIERHTQDQKPEVQRSASPLAAHQLQQKQQRQQTPVQQLHPEDQQQQQQQRRRQRSPSSPPEEWGTPQEHLGSSPAFLACRSRTSSPAVAPPQEIQQEEQVIPQQAAEENSRDSRGTSPAVVFQMDCDPPAVGQTPPVEPTKPQENNAIIEDNMLLKDSIPLECYAPMDDLPISTNEFQDIMSTLDMDMDDMDEFRKALEITNDTPLQPPRETSGSPADHAPTHDISSHHRDTITRQLPTPPPPDTDPEDRPLSRMDSVDNARRHRISKSSSGASTPAPARSRTPLDSPEDHSILAKRRAAMAALSPEPPIFEFARELTPTPPPSDVDSIPNGPSRTSPEIEDAVSDDFSVVTGEDSPTVAPVTFEPTPKTTIPDSGPTFDKQEWETPQCKDSDAARRGRSVLFSPEPPIFEFARELTPTPVPSEADSISNGTPSPSPEMHSRSSSRCSQRVPSERPLSPETVPSERIPQSPEIPSLGNSEGNRCDIVFASRKAELDALSPEPPIFEFARELTPTPPPTEPDSPLEASPCSSPEVSRIQINGIQKALMETVSQEPTVLKSGRKIIPERSPSCDREPIGDMIRETLESPLITDVLPENGDDDVVVRRAASVLFSPQPPIFEFAQEITPTPSPPGTDSTPCSTPCTSPSIIHSYSDETQKSTLKVISPATPNSGISGRNMSETPPTIEKAPSCLLSEEEDDATVDTGKAHKSTVLLRLKSPEPISSPVQEIRPVSRLSGKESPEESQRHGGAGDVIRTAFRRKALAALSPEPPIFEFARELTPTPPPSEGSLESERGLSASPDPNVSQSQTQMEITEAAGPGPPDFDFARKSISRSEKSDSPAESKQNPRPEIEVCFSPQRTNSSLSRQETPHGVNKNDVSDSRRAALAALSPEPPIFEFARELTPTPPPPGDIPLDMTPVQDSPSLRESEDQTNTVRKVDMNTFSPEPPIFEFAQELPPTPPPEKDFSRAQSMNKDNCPTLLEENTGRFSSKQTTMDSAQLNTPTASSRPNDCAKPGRRAVSALRSPDPPIFEFWHESSPTPSPSISLSNSNASLTESCSSEREDKSKQNGETTAVPFSCNKGYDGDLSEADLSSSSSPESSSSDSVRKPEEPVPSTPRKNQVDDLVIGEDAIVSRRRAILAAFSPEPPIFEFARELTPTPSPTDKDPDFDVTLCASPEVSKNQVNGTEGKYPKEEIPELPIDEVVREITPTPPPSEKDFVSDISMSEDDVSVTLSFDPSSSDVNRDFTPTPTLSDMNPIFDLAMWGSPRDDLIEAHRAAMEVFKAEGLIFDSDEDRTPTPKPSENKHVNGFPTVAEIEGAKQPPQGSELAKVFRERKAAADRRGVEPAAQTLSEDHSPTPKPTLQIPELRPTSIAHPRQRPKESIPVPTPPPSSEPQDVPQSHDGDGSLTKETNSLPWWEQTDDTRSWSPGSPIFKKDVINNRAASPEPPVIAPPPPKSDSPAVWWFDDISQSIPPPPPVMPGKHIPAPPPPPMPGQPAFEMPKLRPMTERKRKTIDCIKKAARGRPDWFSVMKNIEGGVQLRHVDYDQKSDRSRPMLPSSRGRDGQFLYESEKPNQHNALLNQISRGVRLRRVKTNDRSSVDFKSLGMKKFRRQVTVEEKEKKDKEDALPSSSDEEEDIDKMRDDLEATKAQITEELKHRRKAERENKILKIDVDSLNAQIKKLKRQLKEAGITNGPLAGEDEIIPKLEKSMSRLRMREEEEDFSELDNLETEINNLKSQADAHKKVAEDWERKYQNMEQKLQVSETTADEWESRSIYFEKKFRALQKEHNIELPDIGCVGTQTDPADFPPPTPVAPPPAINEDLYAIPRKSSSRRSFSSQFSRMESFKEEDSEDSDRSESEEDDDDMGAEADMEEEEEDGGDDEAAMARKAENEAKRKERDLNLWKSKLTHMKEKEGNVQRERNNLRERIKKYFRDMKTERQEYLKVKADMDELAGVVKEPSEYEESEEEELPPEAEDGVCWFEPAPKKKKLKKRRRRLNADGEEIEDEEEEEDLEDLSLLEEPEWTDSECAESETDNEEEEFNNRLGKLSDRTRKHELHMNKMKKDNYLLKGQVERADEMYLVERRRHQRQDEELHMILAEM